MKGIRTRSCCAALLLAVACSAAAAPATPAPVVTSSVTYTLTITPDSGVTITVDPLFASTGSAGALANSVFDSAFQFGPFPPLSASAADGLASANVSVNGSTTSPDAEGSLDAQAAGGKASSSTSQSAGFLVTGSGSIDFTLAYTLTAGIDPAASDGATVLSRLSLGINIGDNGLFTETGLGAAIVQGSTASDPNHGAWGTSDTTTLTFSFDEASGNDAFFIDLSALSSVDSALTAVPLPPGLHLMLLLAAGLPLLRRRT